MKKSAFVALSLITSHAFATDFGFRSAVNLWNKVTGNNILSICSSLPSNDSCRNMKVSCNDKRDAKSVNASVIPVCKELASANRDANCSYVESCIEFATENKPISERQADLCKTIAKSKRGSYVDQCLKAQIAPHVFSICEDYAKWGLYDVSSDCIAALDGKTTEQIDVEAVKVCRIKAGSSAKIHWDGLKTCLENAEKLTSGSSDIGQRIDSNSAKNR